MSITTMPGPLGRPLETVSPDVSECNRMPCRRRPVTSAATPWAPSWVIVISIRVYCHATRGSTRAPAVAAASTTRIGAGGGWTAIARRHTSAIRSTASSIADGVNVDVEADWKWQLRLAALATAAWGWHIDTAIHVIRLIERLLGL